MLNISPNSSFVRDISGITTDRLKFLLHQTSQRQLINRDKQITQKRILFSVIFLCLVQVIVYVDQKYFHKTLNKSFFLVQTVSFMSVKKSTMPVRKKIDFKIEKTVCFSLEKFIIVTCIAYTLRVLAHYVHLALAKYVFLTKTELKQIGLTSVEAGFVVCDDPAFAEIAYNRHKYFNRFLCWISPQLLYTNILNKQNSTGPTLPLRVLTATLADRVATLVNQRQPISPNKFDQQV